MDSSTALILALSATMGSRYGVVCIVPLIALAIVEALLLGQLEGAWSLTATAQRLSASILATNIGYLIGIVIRGLFISGISIHPVDDPKVR